MDDLNNRSNIITPGAPGVGEKHVVENYSFKVLSEIENLDKRPPPAKRPERELATGEAGDTAATRKGEVAEAEVGEVAGEEVPAGEVAGDGEENSKPSEIAVLGERGGGGFRASFVEDLLKKTDELSSNIIKLQMQVENQENEFHSRLANELENAKEKYTKEGYEQARAEQERELETLRENYAKSAAKLDEAAASLAAFIDKNEKELATTAIDIAKEVVAKELEANSARVALALAKDLIAELKNAGAIELRVNSKDYEYLKEQLGEEARVRLSLDDAISRGSVVVLSDAGNIEASLAARFNKLKKLITND